MHFHFHRWYLLRRYPITRWEVVACKRCGVKKTRRFYD